MCGSQVLGAAAGPRGSFAWGAALNPCTHKTRRTVVLLCLLVGLFTSTGARADDDPFLTPVQVYGTGGVGKVAISPDESKALFGYGSCASLWDLATGQRLQWFGGGLRDVITAVALSPDGQWVLTGSLDGTARIWDAATGDTVRILHDLDHVTDAVLSADGKLLLTSGESDYGEGADVRLWDAATGTELGRFEAAIWSSLGISSDGSRWFGLSSGLARVWDSLGAAVLLEIPNYPPSESYSVTTGALSPDGRFVWLAYHDGVTHQAFGRLYDVGSGAVLRTFHIPSEEMLVIACAEFSPDGSRIVASDRSHQIAYLWDRDSGAVVRTLRWGSEWSRKDGGNRSERALKYSTEYLDVSAGFTPRGRVWTLSWEGLRIWDVQSGNVEHTFPLLYPLPNTLSPSGQYIVARRAVMDGSESTNLMLCSAATGQPIRELPERAWGDVIRQGKVVFFSDSRRLLSVSVDPTSYRSRVVIWDVEAGTALATLPLSGLNTNTVDATVSPDGNWILTSDGLDDARVWSATSGALITTFPRFAWTHRLLVSPDSRLTILTEAGYGTALYEIATGTRVRQLSSLQQAFAFLADGDRIIGQAGNSGPGGQVYVWDLISDREVHNFGYEGWGRVEAVSPDTSLFLFWDWPMAGKPERLVLYDMDRFSEIQSFSVPKHVDLQFSFDNRFVYGAGDIPVNVDDGLGKLWSMVGEQGLSVFPEHYDVDFSAGAVAFTVSSSDDGIISWDAIVMEDAATWLRIVSGAHGRKGDDIVVAFDANHLPIVRTGVIRITVPGIIPIVKEVTITQAEGIPIAGDVDFSGDINAVDVQIVINAALDIPSDFDCDFNVNGTVDASDVQYVVRKALGL